MRRLILVLAMIAIASPTFAQTPPAEIPNELDPDWPLWLAGGSTGTREMPPSLGPFNYVREFDQIVEFLSHWQYLDAGSNYGGMIEAESGPLGGVIETDNTLEAIWCWSRYREFSGRNTYDSNVDAAWVYCTVFPAWEEGAGYYGSHNCAWGLTAALQYKASTGDDSFNWYAETCAEYIVDNPLNIWDGSIWQQRLDFFVKGWCAGNLYQYGEAIGNSSYMAEAVTQGLDVLDFINEDPVNNLALEYWAMSSGTAMWGVCNSVFRDDPVMGQSWLGLNAGHLQVWQDWYNGPLTYDWDCSWNVAFANAQFAVSEVEGNPNHAFYGALVTDALLSYDTDDDGGIQAESMDPVTEDMSWVTSYLCKFGVDRLMNGPPDRDVGLLAFAEPLADETLVIGDTVQVRVLAANFGVQDATGVALHFAGGAAGNSVQTIDLSFAALDTLVVNVQWIVEFSGWQHLEAWTVWAGDEVDINNGVFIEVYIAESTDASEHADSGLRVMNNPFMNRTEFRLNLAAEENLRLEIFDVTGRRVDVIDAGRRGAGEHRLTWDGRNLPAGVYLYRFQSRKGVKSGRVVKLK